MADIFQHFLFYVFSFTLLVAATLVITVRNPVRAALFLILAFFSSAAIWLLLEAEFLAIVLVIVYVGAVMVLFLFVVMLLDINLTSLKEGFASNLYLSIGIGVGVFLEMFAVLVGTSYFSTENFPTPTSQVTHYNNTEGLGRLLYTHYVYSFELAAAVLLLAIVAAIALVHRKRKGVLKQDPAYQVQVKAKDRLRIIRMKATEE